MKLLSWMTYGLSSLALALILAIPLSMVVSKTFCQSHEKSIQRALMSLKNGLYRRRKNSLSPTLESSSKGIDPDSFFNA